MIKPIPIFEFAIAAYATTARTRGGSAKGLRESQFERRRQFETSVRSTAPRDGALLVKISVLENAGALTACLTTPFKSVQVVEEIWLGHIEETAKGYSGVVCMAQTPLRHVGWGRRIDFDPTHILDWTISLHTPPQCSALHERRASAADARSPCDICGFVEGARG